jgi:glycosyltransferase involved in cell wall biosynthesis
MSILLTSKNTRTTKHKYHLWIPDIFNYKGGIQTYSAFFLQAIQEIEPNADYHVFLKHDIEKVSNINYLPNTHFYFAGKAPLLFHTPFFVAQLLFYGLLHKPDLIITTHLNFTIAAYWLKRLLGIPYWTIAHGIEAWNINNPKLNKALASADRILAVSNYTRERLITEQNLNPQQITVLPNTFNARHFKIAPKPDYLLKKYNLAPEQPLILTVARLANIQRYKGYDRILKSLPKIRQIIPNVHYIIVGKGEDRSRIEVLIEELKLKDCVTLAGFVPDKQLNDYYNLCDLFAMPSKREGFGIVYLEALACGKPVMGGNRDGAVDALCNGELGVLVDPDNLEEITQSIVSILQKTYSHKLIYQPDRLRQQTIDNYGFQQFVARLAQQIKQFTT